jgi:amidase
VQGYSAGDPYYTAPPRASFLSEVGRDPGKLRIGLMVHAWNGEPTSEPIAQATRDAARHLQSLGHHVEECTPELGVSWEAFVHANAQIWCATLVRWIDGLAAATGRPIDATTLEPSTLANYRYGRSASAVDFAAALEVRNSVARAVGEWFAKMDMLMTPTLPQLPGLLATYSEGADRMSGLEWTARVFRHASFTPPANVAGTPAMSVPLAVAPGEGLPIGIQFAAGFAREDLLLRVAGQLEQSMPWAGRRPAVWAGRPQAEGSLELKAKSPRK